MRPLQRIPAPYISSTDLLLKFAEEFPHVVFYRTGHSDLGRPPRDIFSAGSFTVYQIPWIAAPTSLNWETIRAELESLSQCTGALAGYISYESGFAYESRWHSLPRPESGYAWRFLEIPCWYEANHEEQLGAIFAVGECGQDRIQQLKNLLLLAAEGQEVESPAPGAPINLPAVARFGELTEAQYCEKVELIREDISAGRYYELNFTQRFQLQASRDPLQVFRRVFNMHLPRHAFFCRFNDETIGSCSPELFLKKEGSSIYTRPIKGSMASTTTSEGREKLHAEHIMVVDLARNDLGRVSDMARVAVPELASKYYFGGLTHLESIITGESSLGWTRILRHTLPAASITGAPKVEVVKAISEFEISPRQIYTGTCGWVWPNGDIDFNVAIRTFAAHKQGSGWKYLTGAGGAIVADSMAESEYEECLLKVRPLVQEILACE